MKAIEPVRVRGRVHAGGRGLRGVAVTDGLSVVLTDAYGRYALRSHRNQPFVYITLPADYRIPRSRAGTARLHRPLRPNGRGEATASFELEPLHASEVDHGFVLLADPQVEPGPNLNCLREQTIPDIRALVRSRGDLPMFGLAPGDLVFDDPPLFPEYEGAVRATGLPFFQAVGNHDRDVGRGTDEASVQAFTRHFGPDYYSFDRGTVHYVVLNDVFRHGSGYIGYLSGRQLRWLEADLARVEPGRTVVVTLHIPVLSTLHRRTTGEATNLHESLQNRDVLYHLLEPYRAHLLSGHTHETEHGFEGGCHHHVHGAACGAWWSGPICWDGTPNGYGVYVVRGDELRWLHKATGYGVDHQFRVYPPGSDPAQPEAVIANVWNRDPAWTVLWYEDGECRGEMERFTGYDPLARELCRGAEWTVPRPWIEPRRTAHLLRATPSPHARDVRVEATDRWGCVYSEVMDPRPAIAPRPAA